MDDLNVVSASAQETQEVGAHFASMLGAGDIVCMYGDMGAGKTVFVKGVAKGLGIDGHVSSPTFNIVNTYEGRLTLHHFDAYRIADSEAMLDIGFDEYINSGAVCIIEWAELIEDIIPADAYRVTVRRTYDGDDVREISVKRNGEAVNIADIGG